MYNPDPLFHIRVYAQIVRDWEYTVCKETKQLTNSIAVLNQAKVKLIVNEDSLEGD